MPQRTKPTISVRQSSAVGAPTRAADAGVTTALRIALLVLAATSAASPAGLAAETAGPGERIAIPGARAIDHAGFTVPDLEQAVAFFTDVLGAAVLWRVAPIAGPGSGEVMRDGLNADPRASVRIAMLRLGPNLNVELLEYRVPGETRAMPLNSDLNVGHLAFDVDDIGAAGAYLRDKGVRLLAGPRRNPDGANAGQDSLFFMTSWGMAVELVSRPAGMPYERETPARLFKAAVAPPSR